MSGLVNGRIGKGVNVRMRKGVNGFLDCLENLNQTPTMKKLLYILVVLSFVVSCKPKDILSPESVPLGKPFGLKYLDKTLLGDKQIELVGIADSRCQKNMQCIWQGDVIIKLNISGINQPLILRNNGPTGGEKDKLDIAPKEAVVQVNTESYWVRFEKVDTSNENLSTFPISEDNYTIWLRITKK
jgi:hypothetical protein